MYAVLQSIRGTTTVISQSSSNYIDMIRSGNYIEVFEGTRKECEDHAEDIAPPIMEHDIE